MRGRKQETCVICKKRRLYCRHVELAFQEQGLSEQNGAIVAQGIGPVHPAGSPIYPEHNWILAPDVIEQLTLYPKEAVHEPVPGAAPLSV